MEIKSVVFEIGNGVEVVKLTRDGLENSSVGYINDEIRNLWINTRIDHAFHNLPIEKVDEILAKCKYFMEFANAVLLQVNDIHYDIKTECEAKVVNEYNIIAWAEVLKARAKVGEWYFHLTERNDGEFHCDEIGVKQRLDALDELYASIEEFVDKLEDLYKHYGVVIDSEQEEEEFI